MTGLILPQRRGIILPPSLRRMPPELRRGPRAGDRWGTLREPERRAMPLTPAGPGTHSGLPAFVTESAVLSGGAAGVLPALIATASQSATANRIAYSFDGGVTWAAATVPSPGAATWWGLAYSASLGYAIATATNGTVVSSVDGITWALVPGANLTNGNWRRIIRTFDDTLFVAVGIGGTLGQRVATSPDGVTWTLRTTPAAGSSTSWQSIAQSPVTGRIFAGATASFTQPVIFSDDNGITWAYAGALGAADSAGGNGIIVGESGVVRCTGGQGGTTIADYISLDDGASWNLIDALPPMGSQGVNIAVNDDNGIVIRCNAIGPSAICTIGETQIPPPSTLWTTVSALTCGSPSSSLWVPGWEAWVVATGSLTVHRNTSPTAAAAFWTSTAHGTVGTSITNVKAIPFA